MEQMIVQSKNKIQLVMEVKMNANNGTNAALKPNAAKMYQKSFILLEKATVFACKWIFQHL